MTGLDAGWTYMPKAGAWIFRAFFAFLISSGVNVFFVISMVANSKTFFKKSLKTERVVWRAMDLKCEKIYTLGGFKTGR